MGLGQPLKTSPPAPPAIALLKDKDPGAFLIRDSHSFQGAYGLALKVATPPPSAQPWKGDPLEQLVRHFLIETGPKGVKIKGCPSEPYFGSLSALVSQHSISPLSLPCCLRIPSKDPLEETPEAPVPANMSTAADLLRQGAGRASPTTPRSPWALRGALHIQAWGAERS